MAYWRIRDWTKKVSPSLVWDMPNHEKKLYLTFDDGPTPIITSKVLDILKTYDAKGTFFCLGRNVERHLELLNEIIANGHSVGNHSYSHLKGWRSDNDEYFNDIALASQYIDSKLFRPPYGQIKRSQAKILKYHYKIVMWSVMTHDYEFRISKERCLKATLKHCREGSIIVFHDSVKASEKLFYVLPKLLEEFSSRGFSFDCITK